MIVSFPHCGFAIGEHPQTAGEQLLSFTSHTAYGSSEAPSVKSGCAAFAHPGWRNGNFRQFPGVNSLFFFSSLSKKKKKTATALLFLKLFKNDGYFFSESVLFILSSSVLFSKNPSPNGKKLLNVIFVS